MQEYPIHHKNTTKVARTQHFAAIYDNQISLSSFYPKAVNNNMKVYQKII